MLRSLLAVLLRQSKNKNDGRSSENVSPDLRSAISLYEAGRYSDALDLFARIDPAQRDAQAVYLEGNCLQYSRRFDAAIERYKRLIPVLEQTGGRYAKQLAAVSNQCGLAYLRSGRFAESMPLLERAAQVDSSDPSMAGCAKFPSIVRNSLPIRRTPLSRINLEMPPETNQLTHIGYFFVGSPADARYEEYCALLARSIGVARNTMSNVRVTILTDERTPCAVAVRYRLRIRRSASAARHIILTAPCRYRTRNAWQPTRSATSRAARTNCTRSSSAAASTGGATGCGSSAIW